MSLGSNPGAPRRSLITFQTDTQAVPKAPDPSWAVSVRLILSHVAMHNPCRFSVMHYPAGSYKPWNQGGSRACHTLAALLILNECTLCRAIPIPCIPQYSTHQVQQLPKCPGHIIAPWPVRHDVSNQNGIAERKGKHKHGREGAPGREARRTLAATIPITQSSPE